MLRVNRELWWEWMWLATFGNSATDHLGWTNKIVFLQEKNTQNLFYDFPPIGPGRANSDILEMSGWSFQANWNSWTARQCFSRPDLVFKEF